MQLLKLRQEGGKTSFFKYVRGFQNQLIYIQLDHEKCLLFFICNGLNVEIRKMYWERETISININDTFILTSQLKLKEQGVGHNE